MALLIGLSGKARVGKNSVAAIIGDNVPAQLIGFADHIRKFVGHDLCGFSEGELEANKEVPQAILGGKTPRYAMQTLGTQWGRDTISADIWIKACLRRAARIVGLDGDTAIIGDVRFENEASAIREIGGVIIHVRRPDAPGVDNPTHSSEAGIEVKPGDLVIDNDGDLDALYRKVEAAVRPLFGAADTGATNDEIEAAERQAGSDYADADLRDLPEPEAGRQVMP